MACPSKPKSRFRLFMKTSESTRVYRADIIVDRTVLLELKSVERILPIHEAQTLTYLRLSGCGIDLLMNFNSVLLKDGLHRFIP
ncbi:GxxExxY protein [Rhodopila globiformis]|uniref:GxxExxY protein n=1 Tax=Rhodopila globiformis TaxID=1071 RepID=UPI0023AF239A|nr:GxxExxY protein [Rhodopila globiformis]